MIIFNNALDAALQYVCSWDKKNFLTEVTLIRDVFGKISFLMENTEPIADIDQENLENILKQNLAGYFSGKIYWKKLSSKQKRVQVREEIIVQLIEQERSEWIAAQGISFYIAERTIAKKAWIRKNESLESVWTYEEAIMNTGTKGLLSIRLKEEWEGRRRWLGLHSTW